MRTLTKACANLTNEFLSIILNFICWDSKYYIDKLFINIVYKYEMQYSWTRIIWEIIQNLRNNK